MGLLYAPHDPRRDAAFTIFYMGINLGALISPLLCGWLKENTRGQYHSGFTVAAIGMVIALLTYLLGLRWIVEVDQGEQAEKGEAAMQAARSEAAIAQTPTGLNFSGSYSNEGISRAPECFGRADHCERPR